MCKYRVAFGGYWRVQVWMFACRCDVGWCGLSVSWCGFELSGTRPATKRKRGTKCVWIWSVSFPPQLQARDIQTLVAKCFHYATSPATCGRGREVWMFPTRKQWRGVQMGRARSLSQMWHCGKRAVSTVGAKLWSVRAFYTVYGNVSYVAFEYWNFL